MCPPRVTKDQQVCTAANLDSIDSSDEGLEVVNEPVVNPDSPEASVEGNRDEKESRKIRKQKSEHRGKLAKQASKAHVEMCSKAMKMMDKIQNLLEKYDSNDDTD